MPRFIDDIRASGRLIKPWWITLAKEQAWREYGKHVADILTMPDLPVIVADNVADYYYEGTDQERWDLGRDFPNIAPPYPAFWVEHRLATHIRSKEFGDTDVTRWTTRGRVGMLFNALDPNLCKAEGELPDNVKWILWMDVFIDYGRGHANGGSAEGPTGATFLCVDADGRAIGTQWMQSLADDSMGEAMRNIMAWYNVAFLTISFLHCKNVVLEDHRMDAPLAKKWRARHNGLEPAPYHTLVIEPLKAILRHQGRSHEHGLAKAMHICRGHFRDYREGRGLFGKYHGQFWTPMTVRGTKGKAAAAPNVEVRI